MISVWRWSAAPTVTEGNGDRCRCGRGVHGHVDAGRKSKASAEIVDRIGVDTGTQELAFLEAGPTGTRVSADGGHNLQ